MFASSSLEERCHRILEEKGGRIAEKAKAILLQEISVEGLEQPLGYISEHWRDLLTPSLIVLSCESVGGTADQSTDQAGLAMMLMNLSFRLWDDIADKTEYRRFVPTVLGKFGRGVTLIIGGLTTAKAFSILNEIQADVGKRRTVTRLVWDYWRNLAKAETLNFNLRGRREIMPEEKLKVLEMEGVNVETLMKIGAVLGNGCQDEIEHLGNCGRYLGTILELRRDFDVSINLTFELAGKIRSGALPYTLLWAKDHSSEIEEHLSLGTDKIKPVDIRKIVQAALETKTLENAGRLISRLTSKAHSELCHLTSNHATETLRFLLKAQPKLFEETLSTFGPE